jgi:hypothetical protein
MEKIKLTPKQIELTKHEAEALLSIINVAVKNVGLEGNIARNAIYFQDKLNAVFKEETKDNESDPKN